MSGEDGNGTLPEGWTEARLVQLLTGLESGKRPPGGVRGIASGTPSLGGEHLTYAGSFDFSNVKYVPDEFAAGMKRGRIQRGDILVVKDGATTGKTVLVRGDFPYDNAVANEHLFVCRPAEWVSPEYLAAFLRSPEGQARILAHFQGSAQGGINQGFADHTTIPVPSLNEQRSLAALLDEIDRRQASIEARLSMTRAIVNSLRAVVPRAACSGRLTEEWRETNQPKPASVSLDAWRAAERERRGKKYVQRAVPPRASLPKIPESWAWALLPELGELGRGRSKHRPRNDPRLYGGAHPFIQTGDVAAADGLVTGHTQSYNDDGLAQSRLWPARTVCITIAANIAESALLSYPACFPDSVVGLIAEPALVLPEYVELFIRTARRDLAAFAPATAQANINLAILNNLAVPLPSLQEQEEIVRLASAAFEAASRIKRSVEVAGAALDGAVRATTTRAFSGKLELTAPK